MDSGTVVLIAAGAILGREILVYLWKKFIKVADGAYVTEKNCAACQAKREQADKEFKKEVRENFGIIKGMLFAIASGKEITFDELQKLIARS